MFPLGLPVARSLAASLGIQAPSELRGSRLDRLRILAAEAIESRTRTADGWHAGELIAIATLSDAMVDVMGAYFGDESARVWAGALDAAETSTPGAIDRCTEALTRFYWWEPEGDAVPLAKSLLLQRLLADNPACRTYEALLAPPATRSDVSISGLRQHVERALTSAATPASGPPLLSVLNAAAEAHPTSLVDQVEFWRRELAPLLPAATLTALDRARGILAEAQQVRSHGPGPVQAPTFDAAPAGDAPQFTPDASWMTAVVLISKLTHVWLDQLSRRFNRRIARLDEIPDEALDELASAGVNTLWLVGIWERSEASARIKRRTGNPEALASAYALDDYAVAQDLGGEEAWRALRAQAGARGIRVAVDMVPNHMGVDSRWVVDHPERFLSLPTPPFPAYRFTGPNLCAHPDVEVRLEDGYWDHTDASVVFERRDRRDGAVRYIYHGNDGTSMPWNDTAQLDYLSADTREAVIRTIVAVAQRANVIRFDAAMTLARRHVQRLWHPSAGDAGAIPSRAEHGVAAPTFDRRMPREFWREVVDRIQAEAPDTLLIAEAFWLMEGYFVRTLGMHRVYNSAFMHMIRDEQNADYRAMLKEILAYSPAVLRRFVNFLSNPDEAPVVHQLGRGDKYFGAALMMATLPGLPLLAHGQLEGYREKYGMEYARAYRRETPDEALMARHAQQLYPLLRDRRRYSEVERFELYDVTADDGGVCADVFAYSNADEGGPALIVYHNAYREAAGWIHGTAPKRAAEGDDAPLRTTTLARALQLPETGHGRVVFRDAWSGREVERDLDEVRTRGLFISLGAYQALVLTEIRVREA